MFWLGMSIENLWFHSDFFGHWDLSLHFNGNKNLRDVFKFVMDVLLFIIFLITPKTQNTSHFVYECT